VFEEPVVMPGRIEAACRWPDLRGTARPGKPWLDGMPRLIFLNDMGDTFTESLAVDWLAPYIEMMAESPHIWILLTKRVQRMREFFRTVGYVPGNFWLGTTVTMGGTARRIFDLIDIRNEFGAMVWVSAEPLLEGIKLGHLSYLDWLVVGGESGPGARRMDAEWARWLRDECEIHGIPFFFKQWGGGEPGRLLDGREWNGMPKGFRN
jgi:protein gp37